MLHSNDEELRDFVDLVVHEEAHEREHQIRRMANEAAERAHANHSRPVHMPIIPQTSYSYREGPPSAVSQTFTQISVNLPPWIPQHLLQFVAEEQIREQIYAFVHEEETQ